MDRVLKKYAVILLSLIFAGCAATSTIVTKPKIHTVSRDDVKKLEIKLPERYAVDEFKNLKVKLLFSDSISDTDIEKNKLISILDSEFGKIRKFNIVSIISLKAMEDQIKYKKEKLKKQKYDVRKDGDDYELSLEEERNIEQEIEALETNLRQKQMEINKIDPDYEVVITLTKVKEEQQLSETTKLVFFKLILSYNIVDAKKGIGTTIKSDKIVGLSKRHKIYAANWNKVLRRNIWSQIKGHGMPGGGFNREEAVARDDSAAFTQATERAAKIFVNRLGNSFPAGGKIVDWEEAGGLHQVVIDSGIEHGILKNQIMVLYKEKKNGAATSFAIAKIGALGEKKSTLRIIKWADDDPFANKIISALKASNYELASEEDFYAVAIAMPDPE